jgi:hypothetical protein
MESMQEIRREKVFVTINLNIKEIMQKYDAQKLPRGLPNGKVG